VLTVSVVAAGGLLGGVTMGKDVVLAVTPPACPAGGERGTAKQREMSPSAEPIGSGKRPITWPGRRTRQGGPAPSEVREPQNGIRAPEHA